MQHESLSDFALKKLRQNGVEVLLQTDVKEVGRSEVHLGTGDRIPYGMLVGTVGNTVSPFVKESGLPIEGNRIKTNAAMQVIGHNALWALGDCAWVQNEFDGKPSPPTAQFALRQAKQLAANIVRSRTNLQLAAFRFRPQGLLASIGRRNGVAEIYGVQFSGFIAWVLWRAVYLVKMPSFSRKLGIAVDWCIDAVFGENAVRVGDRAAGTMRKEHYVAGDIVYSKGQQSDTLYFIEKGRASVHVEDTTGAVLYLGEGEYFGLSALEPIESKHTTTVVAAGSLDLIAVHREGLAQMSRNGLTRELVHLLELRRVRKSWQSVLDHFPGIERVHVCDVMVKDPSVLQCDDTLSTACECLASTTFLPVVDHERKLIGSCTRQDVAVALAKGCHPMTESFSFISNAAIKLGANDALESATTVYLRSGLDLVPWWMSTMCYLETSDS